MGKLLGRDVTGNTTMKFVRYRDSDGAFWNTSGSAFEAYNVSNIAQYGIAATEIGATGLYQATDPAPTVLGDYEFIRATTSTLAVADLQTNVYGGGRVDPFAVLTTDTITAASVSSAAAAKIADVVLRRTMANVEASSFGDTLDLHSVYGSIQQLQKASVSGSTLTIKKTDGSTTLGTLTLTVSAGASPVTGVT